MSRRSWKVWVAGIALVQLLVIGVDVALLWPIPCEAERDAMRVVGMTAAELDAQIPASRVWTRDRTGRILLPGWNYPDGSYLLVGIDWQQAGGPRRVNEVFLISTPPPVHPLTRLRRTLARVLPFLGE